MLTTIVILSSILFASVYPLCFWISADKPLKNNFHKFHLGLPNFIGGLAVVGVIFMPGTSWLVKCSAVLWKILFLGSSRHFWKRGDVNPVCMTLLGLAGITVYALLQGECLRLPWLSVPVSVLGAMVLCACVYAMNLGHWYLNVHGLSLHHLSRAVYVFWGLALARLIWNISALSLMKTVYLGETLPLYSFVQTLDGIFLLVAVAFGTVLPVIMLWFVRGTLLVKSTQSATGILYVILIGVLMGDLAYKYYLVKYGIYL